jgi:hypothetical protein
VNFEVGVGFVEEIDSKQLADVARVKGEVTIESLYSSGETRVLETSSSKSQIGSTILMSDTPRNRRKKRSRENWMPGQCLDRLSNVDAFHVEAGKARNDDEMFGQEDVSRLCADALRLVGKNGNRREW